MIRVRVGYHLTAAANLDSIARLGLLPTIGRNSALAGERTPAVWLFPSFKALDDAIGSWLDGCFEEDEAIALIGVHLPDDVGNEPGALPGRAGYEIQVPDPIPPARLRVICPDIDLATADQLSEMARVFEAPFAGVQAGALDFSMPAAHPCAP